MDGRSWVIVYYAGPKQCEATVRPAKSSNWSTAKLPVCLPTLSSRSQHLRPSGIKDNGSYVRQHPRAAPMQALSRCGSLVTYLPRALQFGSLRRQPLDHCAGAYAVPGIRYPGMYLGTTDSHLLRDLAEGVDLSLAPKAGRCLQATISIAPSPPFSLVNHLVASSKSPSATSELSIRPDTNSLEGLESIDLTSSLVESFSASEDASQDPAKVALIIFNQLEWHLGPLSTRPRRSAVTALLSRGLGHHPLGPLTCAVCVCGQSFNQTTLSQFRA